MDGEQRDIKTAYREALADWFENLEETLNAKKDGDAPLHGLSTGFFDLDYMHGGLRKGEVLAIAGRPSMGKSTMALNLLRSMVGEGHKVLLFAPSASRERIVESLLSAETGIDSHRIQAGYLAEREWSKVTGAIGTLADAPIWIDDTPRIGLAHIRQTLEEMDEKPQVVIVEYLQLIAGSARWDIDAAMVDLKALARQHDILLIVVSALPATLERRVDKRPMLSDFGDYDGVAQHADIVWMLYRDEVYNPETEKKSCAEIIVAKHRGGPTGKVELYLERGIQKFQSIVTHYATP